MCQNTNIPRFFLVLRNGRTENTSNGTADPTWYLQNKWQSKSLSVMRIHLMKMRPSLAKFDVTKAAAKSPALQKTCEMLSSLQIHEYEQMRMEV